MNENNEKIYNYLLSGINYLYDLSKRNKELYKIALSKDEGYTSNLLKENMTEKNDISSFLEDSSQDIDIIDLSETSKDEKVNNFIKLLLKSDD